MKMKQNGIRWFSVLFVITAVIAGQVGCSAEIVKPLRFDTADHGEPGDKAPVILPWKTVELDPGYNGLWVVAGDLDGDGQVEIVSSRNVNEGDVHYTCTAVAQKLDGRVLWRWGEQGSGRANWHHDVATQIHDWDGDGKLDVILATDGFLVELDGKTGKEKRRLPIPAEASDCIVFANLSGKKHASDVLVKNRYRQIWAYDVQGKLLWTVTDPGGYRTAHQPRPIDIDGDGRDEIMAGYALLNSDGSVRWVYQSKEVDQKRGHLDCVRVLKKGKTPNETRLALTCCGADNIAVIDGNGNPVWERSGHHFESITIARIFPDLSEAQVVVDIDHRPKGESPLWIFDEDGNLLGQIMSDYCRHHTPIDWTGDGLSEIVIAYSRGLFDRQGKRIATLAMHTQPDSIITGDMTGDGIPDLTFTTEKAVYIFKNEKGTKPAVPVPFGSGVNYSLY